MVRAESSQRRPRAAQAQYHQRLVGGAESRGKREAQSAPRLLRSPQRLIDDTSRFCVKKVYFRRLYQIMTKHM